MTTSNREREQMKRRIYLAGLIVATAIAMEPLATRLTAFATNGHTWGVKQVPYYINPANKYMSDTSAVAGITSAASTWRGVANISLAYAGYTDKSSLTNDGVNAVFFRDDSSGYIAEAYWWWDGSGRLVDADIVYHENYKFYSGNMGCNGDGYYIENTGSHEFGHLLGLAHSSVDTAAMWAYSGACETIRETLDPDDIAGLQSLYPGSTTSTTAPSAPSGLTAAAGSASPTSSVAMSWADNATNETGYVVERSSDGATFSQRAQLGAGATSYLDSGLASGATYYYRVSAYNSAGSSGYSNVASGQTQAAAATPTAPNAPSGLTAAAGSASPTSSVAMSWADNATNETGYVVERSSDGATFSQRAQLGAGATSYLDSGLASGTTYYYRVSAYNSAGSSGYSNVASGQTQAAAATPTAPNAPSGLTAAAGSASPTSSVAMSWADNATNETGYVVERSSDGATFSQRAQLGAGATSYLDSGLASGTTYYYRVSAYNSAGSSGTRTSRPAKRRLRRPLRHRPRRPRPRPRIRHRPTERPGSTGASRSGGQGPTPRVTTCI